MDDSGHGSGPSTDAELLAAWRSGNRSAGELLFARYYDLIERFFLNKIAAERVADLVQETFVACVEGRDRVLEGARFRAYLLGIAYHVFCRHLRQRYRSAGSEILDQLSIHELADNPSSAFGRRREHRLLLEGLRAIPFNYQVVLELHYWERLTTNEIAQVLAIPPGTARSRLRRARDALEAAMGRLARSNEVLESTLTRLDDWAADCGQVLNPPATQS